jgi:K+-transporting ATPase c subunit
MSPSEPHRGAPGLVPVEILHTSGCGNWQAARDAVRRVAGELRVAVELTDTVVDTQKDAAALRFVGSPSVRVSGHDVQPEAERRTDYGLG